VKLFSKCGVWRRHFSPHQRQDIADLNSIGAAAGEEREALVRQIVEAGLPRDVFSQSPTAVTVNFGMNDGGMGGLSQQNYEAFIACQTEIARQLTSKGIRVAFITPRPMERSQKPAELAKIILSPSSQRGWPPLRQSPVHAMPMHSRFS